MTDLPAILAAKDEDPLMKIIFFAVFALIWVISAVAKAASAKREQARREKVRQELEASRKTAPDWGEIANRPVQNLPPVPQRSTQAPPMPPAYNPSAPPPQRVPAPYAPSGPPPQRVPAPYAPSGPPPQRQQQMNMPSKRPPPIPVAQQQQRKQKKQKKQRQEPVFAEAQLPSPPSPIADSPFAPAKPTRAAASQQVDANQLRGWLRPSTLRDQFMLTEILRPPLALRRSDD